MRVELLFMAPLTTPWGFRGRGANTGRGCCRPACRGGRIGNATAIGALALTELDTPVSDETKAKTPMEAPQMHDGTLARAPATALTPPLAGAVHGMQADMQSHLGRQLRAVYDEMASQPVPDRFVALLDALERQQPRTAPPAGTKQCPKVGTKQ